jgi:hypothetical protein
VEGSGRGWAVGRSLLYCPLLPLTSLIQSWCRRVVICLNPNVLYSARSMGKVKIGLKGDNVTRWGTRTIDRRAQGRFRFRFVLIGSRRYRHDSGLLVDTESPRGLSFLLT